MQWQVSSIEIISQVLSQVGLPIWLTYSKKYSEIR
jgi:hypothetical protein